MKKDILPEFWKNKLKVLRKHVEKNPNDLVSRDSLNDYLTNKYLKKYLIN